MELEAWIVEWKILGCPPHRFLVVATEAALMDAQVMLESVSGVESFMWRAEDLDLEKRLHHLWQSAREALASVKGSKG